MVKDIDCTFAPKRKTCEFLYFRGATTQSLILSNLSPSFTFRQLKLLHVNRKLWMSLGNAGNVNRVTRFFN